MTTDSKSLTSSEKRGAWILLITVCACIGGYFVGDKPSSSKIDFLRVSRMSCNDNGTVPSKWADGRIFIELREANSVQVVMKDTGVIYAGEWQASGRTLAMTVDFGVAPTGTTARLKPIKKVMEDVKVIGVNSDGLDTISASGFTVKCAIQRK
jgi:hypothetical protein